MYIVTIYIAATEESVDIRFFDIGKWQEIGFWLDHNGYIDSEYKIGIRIVEG